MDTLVSNRVDSIVTTKIKLEERSSFMLSDAVGLHVSLTPSPFPLHIQFDLMLDLSFSGSNRGLLFLDHLKVAFQPDVPDHGSTKGLPPFVWRVFTQRLDNQGLGHG